MLNQQQQKAKDIFNNCWITVDSPINDDRGKIHSGVKIYSRDLLISISCHQFKSMKKNKETVKDLMSLAIISMLAEE